MTRIFALPVTVIATAMAMLAADPLAQNQSQEPDSFDIEPPVLKQNLTDQPLPTAEAPDGDVARLENQLDRAKELLAGVRLYRVLAAVEARARALFARCEFRLIKLRSCFRQACQLAGAHSPAASLDELELRKASSRKS